jgi:hypothetical protein
VRKRVADLPSRGACDEGQAPLDLVVYSRHYGSRNWMIFKAYLRLGSRKNPLTGLNRTHQDLKVVVSNPASCVWGGPVSPER